MSRIRILTHVCLVAILLAAPCLWQQAAAAAVVAGKVVFVRGTPQAVDPAGHSRTLSRGSEVYAGEKLVTVSGRLQVSFVDGAFVSVQPNSEFQIDTYRYSGKQDGTESAVYSLLKGGVRAVTGLIGKKHPDAFKVRTAVATIGIRGTGFSSRLCEGDCPGEKDGLYHYTWEGTTYVFNNVQSRDVPRGSGVYVHTINSPIEILTQPPAVTAVDTGEKLQRKQRENQDTSLLVASGDQRGSGGVQVDVEGHAGGTNEVITGLGGEHINVDDQNSRVADAGGLDNLAVFLNSGGQPIGGLFVNNDHNCNSTCTSKLQLATVDVNAMLQGNNAEAVAEVQALLAGGNQSLIAQAQNNPAQVAESYTDGTIGWVRWSSGDVLVVSDNGETVLNPQVGYQSIHLIYGPIFDQPLPTSGGAVYTFAGGTQSTSLSGATIGQGVTGGYIAISDFSSGQAALEMDVSHVSQYTVAGYLTIGSGGSLHGDNVIATTGTPDLNSACYPSCGVEIDGGFAGPATTGGLPSYAGLSYTINETDKIIGVAGFKLSSGAAPVQ